MCLSYLFYLLFRGHNSKYTVLRGTSYNHEIMVNIISTDSWGFLTLDIKVQWKKMILIVQWVCCGIFCKGVWRFWVVKVVLVWQMIVVEIDYEYGSKCAGRCLFSCRHLDNSSDFLLSRMFYDGWVIIARFNSFFCGFFCNIKTILKKKKLVS